MIATGVVGLAPFGGLSPSSASRVRLHEHHFTIQDGQFLDATGNPVAPQGSRPARTFDFTALFP